MNNDPTISSQSRPLPHQRVWLWYKRRSKIGKLGYGCLSLIVLVFGCSICGAISSTGSSQKNTAVSASPTTTKSTQASKPTSTPKPQTPKDRIIAIANANDGVDNNYIESLKVLQTTVILGMQWDNAWMKKAVEIECFDMQKALWTAVPQLELKTVIVTVKGDVVDKYGKESKEQVGYCTLKSETAAKFNWSNLTWRAAWEAYDNKGLAPFLQNA